MINRTLDLSYVTGFYALQGELVDMATCIPPGTGLGRRL